MGCWRGLQGFRPDVTSFRPIGRREGEGGRKEEGTEVKLYTCLYVEQSNLPIIKTALVVMFGTTMKVYGTDINKIIPV